MGLTYIICTFADVKKMSLHSLIIALAAGLMWFAVEVWCGNISFSVCLGGETNESAVGYKSAVAEETDAQGENAGEITGREWGQEYASFKLSAKTGETAIGISNIITAPAQVTVERRTNDSARCSFARVIAEHIGSTVVCSRFGLLTFKHTIHSNHSLLSRICVLLI